MFDFVSYWPCDLFLLVIWPSVYVVLPIIIIIKKKKTCILLHFELVFHEIVKYQGPLMVWSLTEMDDKPNTKTKSNKKDLNFEGQKWTLVLVLLIYQVKCILGRKKLKTIATKLYK